MAKIKKELDTDTPTGKESIDEVMARIQKKYGDDIVVVDENMEVSEVKVIPSGSYGLDSVFGCGGLPKGRIIELFGQESSGKSTLAHYLIAQVQRAGGRAALIDAEFSYDIRYTSSIGVDTSKLLVTQPLHLEAAMGTLRELVETNQFDIIVLDSIAAMAPKSEIEDEFLKDSMALQARKLGAALRVLAGSISRSKTIVIFINQLRDKVGVFYGAKTVTPGGKALKFFASCRLEVSKGDRILDNEDKQIGNFLNITGVKNKVGNPFMKTSVELYYGKGLDLVADTVDFGVSCGVITVTGTTHHFGETKLGVGRENTKKFLVKNEDVYVAIRAAIDQKLNDQK